MNKVTATGAETPPWRWLTSASPQARSALLAASLGWMLDSFDVMLYALVLSALILDFGLSKLQVGFLGSITLVAAAAGGLIFGWIADRYGRTRALIGSILMYAIFTAACGLARNVVQLAIFRILLGFGMGGEWASGASLVAETWPEEHRGKALGLMQSSWAIGYALAAVTVGIVLPWKGWRAVFFVGLFPALITLWLRRGLAEPKSWQLARQNALVSDGSPFREIFAPGRRGITFAVTLMNACTLFAWWGFNLWVPAYLSLPVSQGGVGLSAHVMAILIVTMQAGMWLGYISFGFVSDRLGRRPCYVGYLVTAAVLMAIYGHVQTRPVLLILGPALAFFGTGYFTGFATVTAELYETRIRATAQGFTYNAGRLASAAAPFAVGDLARRHGFGAAFTISAVAFVLAAICWFWIPETRRISLHSPQCREGGTSGHNQQLS
jgi:MFS family permease